MPPRPSARSRALGALTRRAANALVGRSPAIVSSRFVSAKLLPLGPAESYAVLTRPQPATLLDEGLPVPPRELWQRWGSSAAGYLESGREDVETMLRIVCAAAGQPAFAPGRVLDLGCAEGRMLRHLPRPEGCELWGVDINAERIAWAQQYLPPPFRFAVTTTAPHLPFEDRYFDLVYGLSVFTHISDLADAWLLEVVRVLRPGGFAYLTIHDEHSVDLLLKGYGGPGRRIELADVLRRFDEETGVLSRDWVYFALHADPAAQVFHDSAYLRERWGRFAEPETMEREAADYQTAVVLRKQS